jgi:hypothetical protein
VRRREVESDENDEESILQSLPSKSKRRQFSSLCSLPRSSGYLSRGGMLRSFGLERRRAEWSRRGEEAEGVLLQKKRKKKKEEESVGSLSSVVDFFIFLVVDVDRSRKKTHLHHGPARAPEGEQGERCRFFHSEGLDVVVDLIARRDEQRKGV